MDFPISARLPERRKGLLRHQKRGGEIVGQLLDPFAFSASRNIGLRVLGRHLLPGEQMKGLVRKVILTPAFRFLPVYVYTSRAACAVGLPARPLRCIDGSYQNTRGFLSS